MINKGAKVCFVVPPVGPKSIIRDYAAGLGFEADSGYCLPPLDLLQMAACIQHKFEVSCIDAQAEKMSLSELCLQLVVSQVQCCIVEISLPTIEDDLQCINAIGKEKIIVIGKIHSQNSELLSQIFKNSTLNCCIVTECEDNLLEILLGNDRSGTASYEEGVLRIFSKPLVSDLDSLPFPLRQLALQNNYEYPKLGHCTTLLSSRGCPYPCGYYCPYPMVQGKKWRHRSPHSIIEELKSIVDLGINRVLFRDPVFSLNPERIRIMCNLILFEKIEIDWWCETRADSLPNDLLYLMAQAGCKGINIGVESGDTDLRFSSLKQGVSDEVIWSISQKCHKEGIKLAFLLMIGYPGENRQSVLQTADLIRKCRPFSIGLNFPVPHPGTKFASEAQEKGWILNSNIASSDGNSPVLAGSGLSANEMQQGKDLILKLFSTIVANDPQAEDVIFQEILLWTQNN